MKKISIVSSYSDSCGNAYFTKVLEETIRNNGYDVKCTELDLDLTQAIDFKTRRRADQHIENLCSEIKKADACNIQLEAGLYGTLPDDIINRVKKLCLASKCTSVTLHSPRIVNTNPAAQREAIRDILKGKVFSGFKKYLNYKKNSIHIEINNKIIRFLVKKNIPIIVHTIRAQKQIDLFFNYKNVFVHPLKFVSPSNVVDLNKILRLRETYRLGAQDVIVGMFGYVNDYKGHMTALKAMEILPKNYKLFIFGRVHPQTIAMKELINPYIETLNKEIIKSKVLKNRVFYVGEKNTDDFIDFAASVDMVWLPYVEVGQDGSGIASICTDVAKKVLASNSFAFDELLKLIPYPNIDRFDIGNYIELAQKTIFSKESVNSDCIKNKKFSTDTQAKLYTEIFEFNK